MACAVVDEMMTFALRHRARRPWGCKCCFVEKEGGRHRPDFHTTGVGKSESEIPLRKDSESGRSVCASNPGRTASFGKGEKERVQGEMKTINRACKK